MVETKERYYIKCYPEDDVTCLHYIKVEDVGNNIKRIKITYKRNEATLMDKSMADYIISLAEDMKPTFIYKRVKARF